MSDYRFEVKDRAIHLIYTTETEVDEMIGYVLNQNFVDANIIERNMPSHVHRVLDDWRYELDNGVSRIAVVSTSIYLAHLLHCAEITGFQYPIYFIKVGRSMRTSDDNSIIYTWFDVRELISGYDNLSDIREAVSILF
jgi:hypothetical protein